ncbi:high-affinity zinc uptake system ATP-binding protein ZnuC [Lysinibacillus sp. PLM2]|nr:high-affinity zinc uptake system ATP-binding protein ZnuC [Lysinibacillus sp. PLM2]
MTESTIGLKNVTFGYSQKVIVENLSFSIKQGQFVAITGENGAAKTTAMKLLVGLLKPWKGTRQWPKQIRASYVPQQVASIEQDFPSTVTEFILSGSWKLKKWFEPISKEDIKRAKGFIRQFDLGTVANQPIGKLSGGQKQKACIVRALMENPAILLLDEPATGMDEKMRRMLYETLKNLCPQVTIVMITHHIHELEPYIDQLIHLERRQEHCLN